MSASLDYTARVTLVEGKKESGMQSYQNSIFIVFPSVIRIHLKAYLYEHLDRDKHFASCFDYSGVFPAIPLHDEPEDPINLAANSSYSTTDNICNP